MAHELITGIEIDVPPKRVWEALVDFDRYPKWNPLIWIVGWPNEGTTLTVHLQPPDDRELEFEPDVVYCGKYHGLHWVGHLMVPGLFDGGHRLRLESFDDGERTRLEHAETLSDILTRLLLRFVGEQIRARFVIMDRRLKTCVKEAVAAENQKATESPNIVWFPATSGRLGMLQRLVAKAAGIPVDFL